MFFIEIKMRLRKYIEVIVNDILLGLGFICIEMILFINLDIFCVCVVWY